MLNKESRSYFQRAFALSGSVFQEYIFTKANHVQIIQDCSNITEIRKLTEYLKTENSSELLNCPLSESDRDCWVAVIESNRTKDAFLTKTPEQIYNASTDEAPIMDTMVSFTGQVVYLCVGCR